MPTVSNEVLTKAKEKLVTLSRNWKEGVSCGRIWTLDGEESKDHHHYCHSWMTNYFGHGAKATFLTLSAHSKLRSGGICSAEAHEAIILWLASDDSPFSKYILNRDDRDSLLNGGVVILCGRGGASVGEALWICKALRYAVESGTSLDVWNLLVKNGVAPVLALYIATFTRFENGVINSSRAYSHVSVFQGMGENKLPLLLNPVVTPRPESSFQVFDPAEKSSFFVVQDETFKKFCKPFKRSDGWGGTIEGVGSTPKDFVASVLEFQASLGKADAPEGTLPTKKTVYLDHDM